MQKKLGKSQSFIDIENSSTSYMPVNRNGWWIKYSCLKGETILLLFTSMFTGQTIIRYFGNEDEAIKFLNFIIHCNPAEELMF